MYKAAQLVVVINYQTRKRILASGILSKYLSLVMLRYRLKNNGLQDQYGKTSGKVPFVQFQQNQKKSSIKCTRKTSIQS